MSYVQWVNLPKDAVFVDASDGISSVNQLGEVCFTVHLDAPPPTGGKPNLQVAARPVVEPHPYSHIESSNAPYTCWTKVEHDRDNTWMGLGRLPAAGGNEYQVEASLDGDKVSSRSVRTNRKLFFQDFVMKGVGLTPVADVLAKFEACSVVLRRPAAAGGLHHRVVLNYDNPVALSKVYRDAARSWELRAYEPYAFAVLWVDQIGTKAEVCYTKRLTDSSRISMWESDEYAGGKVLGFKLPRPAYLWWKADPEDDKRNGDRGIWFVKDSALLRRADGSRYRIPDADVSLGRPSLDAPVDAYDRVLFRIPTAEVALAKSSELEFKVVVVAECALGISLAPNVVVVVNRCWYQPVSSNRATTFMHEIGHKLGLVPNGRLGLERGAKHYTGQGHSGNHCAESATYDSVTKAWSGTPGCVMFGSSSIGSKEAPATFCGSCSKQLCQIDLNCRGLPGFNVSFTTQ